MLTPAQAAFLAACRSGRPASIRTATRRRRWRGSATVLAADGRRPARSRAEQAREARAERLRSRRADAPFVAPHFVEMVLGELPATTRPARIETTLDAGAAADVDGIIRSQRGRCSIAHGAAQRRRRRARQRDAASGSRGRDRATTSTRRTAARSTAPSSPRQPGSALKPFTYALAFEEGVTPATRAAPTSRRTSRPPKPGVLYSPRNYDGRYRGPLLARRALAGSENVPAVALASQLGVPNAAALPACAPASRPSTGTPSYYGLGVTLGNAEVRLDELVAAYAAFARGGEWHRADVASRGRARGARAPAQLVSPRTAFWITRHPVRRRRARVHLRPRRQPRVSVPGGGEDRHVAGVSRQLDGRLHARRHRRRLGRQLRSHAAARFVRRHRRRADLPRRDARGAAPRRRHRQRVRRRGRRRSARRRSWSARSARSPACRPIRGARRSGASTCRPARTRRRAAGTIRATTGCVTVWPPEYREWARKSGLLTERAVERRRPSSSARCARRDRRRAPALTIVEPADRRDLSHRPDAAPRVPDVAAARRHGTAGLGSSGGSTAVCSARHLSESALDWPLAPGTHVISVRDRTGARRKRRSW